MRAFIFVCTSGFAQLQNTRLTIELANVELKDVLAAIESKTDFVFMFDATKVNVKQKVNISSVSQPLNKILDALFEGRNISYSVNGKQIALTNSLLNPSRSITIRGKVTDVAGFPLPGVSVKVKGENTGTATDIDGNYRLQNVPETAVLQFSYIGMKPVEVRVENRGIIDIVMEEDAIGMQEVVAIGYGSVKKSDLTGSVASVKLKDANLSANTSVMQALQGSVPGLNIGAVTKAGEDPSMLIRGYTSLSAGQSPLIVVDGVIFGGSISDLNTNDIERVDVLKDASSAAVYGSRSANGVIIITTKKGVSEKPTFNFNTYHGIQQMGHKIQMAGGEKYLQKILDWRTAIGQSADPTQMENYLQPLEVQNYRDKTYTDWFDLLTRDVAPLSQYDLSVSGKTSKTNYYLSGSLTDQNGVVIGDDFKRATLRANFSNQISNWLTIGLNSTFSHRDYSGQAVEFRERATFASPLSTVYADKKNNILNMWPHDDQVTVNPLNTLNAKDEEIQDNLFSIFTADIQLPKLSFLKYHFDYSNGLQFYKHNEFWGTDTYAGLVAPNGSAEKRNTELRNWSINNILSFNKSFGKNAFDATLVYTLEGAKGESTVLTSKTFSTPILGWNAMELGDIQKGNSGAWESSSEAFMARLNYTFDRKYLLTATYRRDGYSGFARGNKYANFPSVSLSWVLSEEDFIKPVEWINYLKIRTSYGVNGNQALGSYGSLSQMSMLNYVYGDGSAPYIGIYPNSLANSNLTWEKTTSYNFGLDFNILNNRITGDINFYTGKTNDLLVKRNLPLLTGYNSVWANLGELINNGVEFSVNTVNVKAGKFKWESKFSFSLNRNKINKLYGTDANSDGIEDDDIGNKWFIGKSIGAVYDYTIDGMYQLTDTDIPTGFKPGYYKFKDVSGNDGVITPDDRSVIGFSIPNYRFGIFNEMSWKNMSLSFMINSVQGGGKDNYYIINNAFQYYSNAYFQGAAGKVNIPDIDYWTPTNPSTKYPRLDYAPVYTHGVYEDRSFIRLQDVTFAYSFDKKWLQNINIDDLKIYVSGKNLYTLTKFTGWDPEAGTMMGGGYPIMRSFVAGFNINF